MFEKAVTAICRAAGMPTLIIFKSISLWNLISFSSTRTQDSLLNNVSMVRKADIPWAIIVA